jgi:hypothetical protein
MNMATVTQQRSKIYSMSVPGFLTDFLLLCHRTGAYYVRTITSSPRGPDERDDVGVLARA